jgi:predicted metal-dependent hydrolase
MKIIKSFRKTISLQIKNGEVIVKAPFFMFDYQIKDFIKKHKEWIDKKLIESPKVEKKSDNEILELRKKAKAYIPNRVEKIAKAN